MPRTTRHQSAPRRRTRPQTQNDRSQRSSHRDPRGSEAPTKTQQKSGKKTNANKK